MKIIRPPRNSAVARFWAKVNKSDHCWEWTGKLTKGYGQYEGFGQRYAHRASWVMHYYPIPSGLSVCHRCDNPLCVRPDHLFLGTQRENVLDMILKGRKRDRPRVTHCPKGHPYDDVNGRWVRGYPECRACDKLRKQSRKVVSQGSQVQP